MFLRKIVCRPFLIKNGFSVSCIRYLKSLGWCTKIVSRTLSLVALGRRAVYLRLLLRTGQKSERNVLVLQFTIIDSKAF